MNVARCDEFEVLISAELDGELDEHEQVDLRHHLADCSSCRAWQESCRRVNAQIMAVAEPRVEWDAAEVPLLTANGAKRPPAELEHPTPIAAPRVLRPSTDAPSNGAGRWFLALAAMLLVAIGVSIGVYARRGSTPPSISVEPLAAMHAINLQTEQDQQATLRAVAMDLRMMKLEMKQMPLDPLDREQMENRIDSLLAKTRQMDASTPILYQGESP